MNTPKDNFSEQANLYAAFRPDYPKELFEYLLQLTPGRTCAWDCGTGNGQVAKVLSPYFEKVEATDISQAQLNKASPLTNVSYRLCRAEETMFPDNSFDLITVAQAIHWFDFELFYGEVQRTARPGALLAAWGYGLLSTDQSSANEKIDVFYKEIVGPYWDAERRYIDDRYQTIPFLPNELSMPDFEMHFEWSLEQLEGYFNTWSSVQKFIKENKRNPVNALMSGIRKSYEHQPIVLVHFPVFIKAAKVLK